MAATLDRARTYASITGDTEGRFFEQDGRYFTADGSAWTEAEAAPAPKKSKATATQLDAQLEQG